jgi:cytidylate kinase
MSSKRILGSIEINELLDRLKKGESQSKIIAEMDISSSTLANFKAYFISQGHDISSPIEKPTSNSVSEISHTPRVKTQLRKKRKHTRSFNSFKGIDLKENEVYVRINEVAHIIEQKPKEMILGPTSIDLLF